MGIIKGAEDSQHLTAQMIQAGYKGQTNVGQSDLSSGLKEIMTDEMRRPDPQAPNEAVAECVRQVGTQN